MERKPAKGEHRNIERITGIMDALSRASAGGLRLADVVRETGLGKTTAHRILGGLVATGLAEQDEETGRFFVGLKMLTWASAAKNRFSFARLAEPTLSRISQRTQDTIYLIMRDGDEIVCLDCHEGSFPIRALTLNIGDRRPLGIGAGSLAILAALPDDEVERILATGAELRAPFPFTETRLREMIATTRREGYAYNNLHLFEGMENVTDMAAVSVPIRRRDGTPVAALHLTAIPSRLEPPRRDSIVATLKNEAAEMEEKMEPVLQSIGNPSRAMGKGRSA